MVKFTFDHTQNNYLKACGVKEEQLEQLFEKVNEVGRTCNSSSEIVEKLGKEFSTEELAFVINHLQAQIRELEQPNPMDMLKQMLSSSRFNDEDPSLPLGQGGDA